MAWSSLSVKTNQITSQEGSTCWCGLPQHRSQQSLRGIDEGKGLRSLSKLHLSGKGCFSVKHFLMCAQRRYESTEVKESTSSGNLPKVLWLGVKPPWWMRLFLMKTASGSKSSRARSPVSCLASTTCCKRCLRMPLAHLAQVGDELQRQWNASARRGRSTARRSNHGCAIHGQLWLTLEDQPNSAKLAEKHRRMLSMKERHPCQRQSQQHGQGPPCQLWKGWWSDCPQHLWSQSSPPQSPHRSDSRLVGVLLVAEQAFCALHMLGNESASRLDDLRLSSRRS